MDSIDKFLKRLTKAEREKLVQVISAITQGNLAGLDIKKLRGYESVFRVRVGRIRIIYLVENIKVRIVRVQFRSEDTYRE